LGRFFGGPGWTSSRAWNKQGGWTFIRGGVSGQGDDVDGGDGDGDGGVPSSMQHRPPSNDA